LKFWKNIIIASAAAFFFSFLYGVGYLGPLEDRLYDFFLRIRPEREHTDKVVFLDVDDNAIAYNGFFPWPRSVTGDGLLRLKEFGARAAIFDIEFIDKGRKGVDDIYLGRGLAQDFTRSFSEINSAAQALLAAIKAGRIGRLELDLYAGELSGLIGEERQGLYEKAQSVARDDDVYLAQASALLGKSWVTLNLRSEALTDEEQLRRRPLAEERFTYPVSASQKAQRGRFVDILPPLPVFAETAVGAGFTNVEIDADGIRRRIYLAQNIHGRWYLQLAFAPLVHYLGNPAIELSGTELQMKGALFPGGEKKDVTIPLDSEGRMMLDWPPYDYRQSYSHISFADFSLLEDIESELEEYSRALGSVDISFFAQFEPSLSALSRIAWELQEHLNAARLLRSTALEQGSSESYDAYREERRQSHALIRKLLEADAGLRIEELLPRIEAEFPQNFFVVRKEAEYIISLLEYLKIDLDRYEELSSSLRRKVEDKFCILGRVDTGTTDIGANPFWAEYVNVGTHAVVLDMILSESFIRPLGIAWRIIFTLAFVPLFFIASGGLEPFSRSILGFFMAALVFGTSLFLFRFTGIFFGPLGAVFAMTSAVIIREILSYATSEREKQFIRKAFSTYVSGDVVKEIIADPSRLQLGGTKRHMSAIFTDIQGFSTISERLDPEELVRLLNRYLTAMSDIVLNEKGTIDKYEGDAIIAFFGAPLDLPDHALRACLSAIQMKKTERELNKVILEEGLSHMPLLTRIGINTGSMVAGNMGTENKMNYTIMGNTVNLAARLEGVNKQYGTFMLASEATINETDGKILVRRLDRVRVVGINEPVRLHELVETQENASPGERKLVTVFHEALDFFEKRSWKEAAEGFRETLNLEEGKGPAKKYLDRCEKFLEEPPEDSWDGVYNLTEK
jgi:adenylate cyclase